MTDDSIPTPGDEDFIGPEERQLDKETIEEVLTESFSPDLLYVTTQIVAAQIANKNLASPDKAVEIAKKVIELVHANS